MTIKTRNRCILMLFIISLLVALTSIYIFSSQIYHHELLLLAPSKFSFFTYTAYVPFLAFLIILLYVPFFVLYVYLNFEKTQSTEIIFFILFLVGVLLETTRISIPLFNLFNTYSSFLLFCSKASYFGRLLCLFSFFISSIASEATKRQDIERNLTITIALSLFIAILLPQNSGIISHSYNVQTSFEAIMNGFYISCILLTLTSYILKAKINEHKEFILTGISQILILVGKHVLTFSESIIAIIIGSLLMIIGTKLYLDSIHKISLWE